MIIKKEHAEALLRLLAFEEESKTKGMDIAEVDSPLYLELERQALVRQSAPLKRELTYLGTELALTIKDLVEKGKLAPPEKWLEGFRWLGSEIVAMIEAAGLSGQVGPCGRALKRTWVCRRDQRSRYREDLYRAYRRRTAGL